MVIRKRAKITLFKADIYKVFDIFILKFFEENIRDKKIPTKLDKVDNTSSTPRKQVLLN
jgi:hypothetical protein